MTENRALKLEQFVDGELPPDEVERLTHELTQDVEGAAYVERLRRLRALAQVAPAAPASSDQALVLNFEHPSRPLGLCLLVGCVGLVVGFLGALSLFLAVTVGSTTTTTVVTPIPAPISAVSSDVVPQPNAARPPRAHGGFAVDFVRRRTDPQEEMLAFLIANAPPNAATRLAEDATRAWLGTALRNDQGASTAYVRARDLLSQEQWSKAAEVLTDVAGKGWMVTDAQVAFWRGYALYRMGDFTEAVNALTPFKEHFQGDSYGTAGLQLLGMAHQGAGQFEAALRTWAGLAEKASPWKHVARLSSLELLATTTADYASALVTCEKLLADEPPPEIAALARRRGAQCLTLLGRHDEALEWMAKHFNPIDPVDEAWRDQLEGCRLTLAGDGERGPAVFLTLAERFPELSPGDRRELVILATRVLRNQRLGDKAKALLEGEIRRAPASDVAGLRMLLTQWLATVDAANRREDDKALAALAQEPNVSPDVRIVIHEYRVDRFRERKHVEEAENVLRQLLAEEHPPHARLRYARALARLLAEDRSSPREAVIFLGEELSRGGRNDHVKELTRLKTAYEAKK